MSSAKKARVVAVHPEDHSVDVVLLGTGCRLTGVQVLSSSASTNTGLNDLVTPATAEVSKWDEGAGRKRYVLALVDFADGDPYVAGFLFPQICQMTFKEADRRVDRHASDFYHTIDAQGNAEWYHPSGTYLRMGTSPAHEDLTGKDFDGEWKIAKNTGTAPHVQLVVANGGAAKCTVNIDPSGNVTVTSVGKGRFVFPAGTEFETPEAHFTGKVTSDGDMIAGSISLQNHVHTEQGDGKDVSKPK